MKHIFLLISFFISLNMFAINPQKGFNYQAVLRDASGMVIKEQSVTLQVTIMSDNQVAYKETHQLTTSATGYINMVIGNGSRVFGTFEKTGALKTNRLRSNSIEGTATKRSVPRNWAACLMQNMRNML